MGGKPGKGFRGHPRSKRDKRRPLLMSKEQRKRIKLNALEIRKRRLFGTRGFEDGTRGVGEE